MKKLFLAAGLIAGVATCGFAQDTNAPGTSTNAPEWVTRPLALIDTLNIALAQNATILKAQNDLEAAHGVVIQTRRSAVAAAN